MALLAHSLCTLIFAIAHLFLPGSLSILLISCLARLLFVMQIAFFDGEIINATIE